MPPTPPGAPRYTRTQRRLLTVSAGLGVAVLAGVAFVVTYGDLRALVVQGHAPRRLAAAYPVMFDTLITVTILALVVARNGRWWIRWPRWLLLLVLLAGAGAASMQRATKGYGTLPSQTLKAGVAVAPHVMLLLAVWLWLGMFRQIRAALARRAEAAPHETPPGAPDGPPPTVEVPVVRSDTGISVVPGFGQDYEPKHELAGAGGTPEDAGWQEPWVPEEAPLDWALGPYDPEPAPPYEPDPAAQPYAHDQGRPYSPDPQPIPVQPPGPDPVQFPSPEPVREPVPSYSPEPVSEPVQPYSPEPAPESALEPVQEPAVTQEPAPEPGPVVPLSSLPGDVKLVGRPAATTQPDLVIPGVVPSATETVPDPPAPDPQPGHAAGTNEDEDGADVPPTDRAEDPDAGDDQRSGEGVAGDGVADDVERWSAEAAQDVQRWADDAADSLGTDRPETEPESGAEEATWRPPSSTFRSSPTPPDD